MKILKISFVQQKPWIANLAACFLSFLLLSSPGFALDIVARTAKADENPVQEFESPMVLEIPLPDVLKLARDQKTKVGSALSNYVCEDAAIFSLWIQRGKTTKAKRGKKALAELSFEGFVRVQKSHDRLVTLTFSLMKGEKSELTFSSARLEAEEEENTPFLRRFYIPVDKLEALYSGEPAPHLQILMKVVDD